MYNRFFVFILFVLFFQSIFAQEYCRRLFVEATKTHLNTNESQIPNYVTAVLKRAKKELSKLEFINFRDWYLSHFFYGRSQILMGNMLDPNSFTPQMFVKRGEDPFLAYMITRENVMNKPLEQVLTIEGLSEIQESLLTPHSDEQVFEKYGRISQKSSERATNSELGTIRWFSVINLIEPQKGVNGTSALLHKVSDKSKGNRALIIEKRNFEKNRKDYAPQLSVTKNPNPERLEHLTSDILESPQNYKDLEKVNPYLSYQHGYVEYVGIQNWKKYLVQLSPELISQLKQAELAHVDLNAQSVSTKKLTHLFITDLVNFEIRQLKAKLGMSQNSLEVQVNAIAQFYWNLMSIHPFGNGNGRTLRLLLERVLQEVNLPPPIWTFFEQDAYRSLAEFTQILKDSIFLSKMFHAEIYKVAAFEPNKIKSSLSFFLMPPSVIKQYLAQLKKSQNVDKQSIQWNYDEFKKFVELNYQTEPEEKHLDAFLKWQVDLQKSTQELTPNSGLRLIPSEYIQLFDSYSKNVSEYNNKRTYYRDDFIYRGTVEEGVLSIENVVNSFLRLSASTQGNGFSVSNFSVLEVFDLFNMRLLQKGKVEGYLKSQFAGESNRPEYWTSLMASWSTQAEVALKYADTKLLDNSESGYSVFIEAYRPRYGAFDYHDLKPVLGSKIKASAQNDVAVVGSILPEMIQRMRFIQGKKKKGILSQIFSRNSEGANSTVFTVERIAWNELLVTEFQTGDPFLNVKQYKVILDPVRGLFNILGPLNE